MDRHCLSFRMWICINNLDQVIWLAEIRSGCGSLIYSAGQGLILSMLGKNFQRETCINIRWHFKTFSLCLTENRARHFMYEGCSKWIAYFYLETSNFKLAQKYSFNALEVLPVARNAKFQPMYPLLEGVTVRWFGHSNKVLMNGRSKCLSGLVFPPSKECFQFQNQKEITWGMVWGIQGVRQNSYFFFLQKRRWGKTVTFSFFKNAVTIAEVWAGALSCRRRTCLKPVPGRRFW